MAHPLRDRTAATLRRRFDEYGRSSNARSFLVNLGGRDYPLGPGTPEFTITAHGDDGLRALASLDQLIVCEAYLHGAVDIEGDMIAALSVRDFFKDRHPLRYAWKFIRPRLVGQTRSDKEWIPAHYDIEADFFLAFLDTRYRCYSHGIFESPDESLEDAIERKLQFAVDAIGARPGDRVLDIGGGWGAFTEFAGKREIRVTSLTISRESERFLNALIERERLPCRALYEHFYEHVAEPYDAIVILGVTEHLPDYERSLDKYRSLLKPGGKLYLDASAQRRKYRVATFLERHIYPGNGSPMCLHDYLAAVAASPFELEQVLSDRESYAITARHWAERLDRNRAALVHRWGEAQYRKFRLFLWGCADGFMRDRLQAYRAVLSLGNRLQALGTRHWALETTEKRRSPV